MAVKDIVLDLAIRYGFQVLGALVILAAGAIVARWIGQLVDARLQKQAMEPPMRLLIVRVLKVVVMLFAAALIMGLSIGDIYAAAPSAAAIVWRSRHVLTGVATALAGFARSYVSLFAARAIRDGDPEAAAHATSVHLDNTLEDYRLEIQRRVFG